MFQIDAYRAQNQAYLSTFQIFICDPINFLWNFTFLKRLSYFWKVSKMWIYASDIYMNATTSHHVKNLVNAMIYLQHISSMSAIRIKPISSPSTVSASWWYRILLILFDVSYLLNPACQGHQLENNSQCYLSP